MPLAGAAATPLVCDDGRCAAWRAAAPAAGKQAPGWYRYKVGSFEVTVVDRRRARASMLHDNLRRQRADRRGSHGASSRLHADGPHRSTTIRRSWSTPAASLLSSTPAAARRAFKPARATAVSSTANLAAAGIDPKAIDTVIISHFHGDHVNGLLTRTTSSHSPMPKFWCRRRSGSSGWTTAR